MYSQAIGQNSHVEGVNAISFGPYSHAEGAGAVSSGSNSHAEGQAAIARGQSSHAEGWLTIASGSNSHAEGRSTIALGVAAHSEGQGGLAKGNYSHTEGQSNVAHAQYSHAEGLQTIASGSHSHAEGYFTIASGSYSHAEGQSTIARGLGSHAEGAFTQATGSYSHAEGYNSFAMGYVSHAEGQQTTTRGSYSHAEGTYTFAYGESSHAEGGSNNAVGNKSHAEGQYSSAGLGYWNVSSIASGLVTFPSNLGDLTGFMFPGQIITLFSNLYTVDQVQFVGGQTKVQLTDTSLNAAFGYYSLLDTFTAVQPSQSVGFVGEGAHAEGYQTIAIGASSHAEGYNTFAIGNYSHTEGYLTTADGDYQLVVGKYNIPSTVEGAFIIGNGNLNGSNLLHAAGNTVEITGSLEVIGGITGSLLGTASTASYVEGANVVGMVDESDYANYASAIFVSSTFLPSDDFPLIFSSNIINDYASLYNDVSNLSFNPATNKLTVSGSQVITGSLQVTGSLISRNTTILTQVSESLNFVDDTAAAAGGVPLGGLYRNNNFVMIRIV